MKKWMITGVLYLFMALGVPAAQETSALPGCPPAVGEGAAWAETTEEEAQEAAQFKTEKVEKRVVFGGMEGKAELPDELLIEYNGGKDYYPMKSVMVLEERWEENLEIPVLFYVYDADYYEFGEHLIPRVEGTPGLEGREEELLAVLGLSPEDYVIQSVVWNGEPYLDEEGIQCRAALAIGKKRVRDYEAVYGGEAVIPVDQTEEEIELEPEKEDTGQRSDVKVKTVEKETGDTIAESEAGPPRSFWSVFQRVTAITAALSLLIFILALILIFIWKRSRKRKDDRQTEKR